MSHSISESSYLKCGEFARFCNTTKETLRHYRDEGLLVPAFRGDNGYLYYSPLQVSDFMLISALAKAGSSLHEIKGYLHAPESDRLEALIERDIEQIRQKRMSLLHQQRMLERTLARKKELAEWLGDDQDWRVVEEAEERFLPVSLSALFDETADRARNERQVQDLLEHLVHYLNHNGVSEIQSVYKIEERALEAGVPALGYSLCFRIPRSFKKDKGFLKPAGRYFQMLRSINVKEILDSNEDLFKPYTEFLGAARRHGFSPRGDMFEQELSLYGGDMSDTFYSRLSIRID